MLFVVGWHKHHRGLYPGKVAEWPLDVAMPDWIPNWAAPESKDNAIEIVAFSSDSACHQRT